MNVFTNKPNPKGIENFGDSPPWSKLPLDMMQMVFERLSYSDFESAKSICKSWHIGWRQSKPNNKIPWMILQEEDKSYALLFNPQETREKLYKTQHIGQGFGNHHLIASYRSWLLMYPLGPKAHDPTPFYIINILNRERINLPSPPSPPGMLETPVLWIDDKTKDYLVISSGRESLDYYKKGDTSWKQISSLSGLQEGMAFKDHMLYCLTRDDQLCVFDFSGEPPLQVSRFSIGEGFVQQPHIFRFRLPDVPWEVQEDRIRHNVVVTVRGHVLLVRCRSPCMCPTWNFEIFKMDLSNGEMEEMVSLGDETMLLDLGTTVLAKDHQGLVANSIYFTGDDISWFLTEIFVYNLGTNQIEHLPQHVSSAVEFTRARWFLPKF